MTFTKQQLEAQLVEMITDALSEAAEKLRRVGLRADVRPVRRTEQERYSSEIAVWFWANERPIVRDVLEFSIYRDDEIVADISEVKRWFNDSLAEIMSKY